MMVTIALGKSRYCWASRNSQEFLWVVHQRIYSLNQLHEASHIHFSFQNSMKTCKVSFSFKSKRVKKK